VNLKQKLEKCELDLENTRKSGELSLVPLSRVEPGSAELIDTPMLEPYDF
jgi:nucleoprotein TPR